MVEYAHRCHWVEQYHKEAKGELGRAQYQGRLWHGIRRNVVRVMLSQSFLLWLESRQMQLWHLSSEKGQALNRTYAHAQFGALRTFEKGSTKARSSLARD